ncbi:MAG: LysM peptidoglycan-binding domain-containing protein [Verrucomicrobiota bacterium]
MKITHPVCLLALLLLGGAAVEAQIDSPAEIADSEIERRTLLRAADQIELLVKRVEELQKQITASEKRLDDLEDSQQDLANQFNQSKELQQKQQQALIEEVSKLIAEGQGADGASQESAVASNSEQEGYEHTVQKGQSLWAIANAFNKQGVTVTVEDIRKANNLGQDDFIQVGQKLFIPKSQ